MSLRSLPSELLARVLELVTESAWKDGPQPTPSVMELSAFPGRRLDGGDRDGAVEDQLEIDGSFPILSRLFTYLNAIFI